MERCYNVLIADSNEAFCEELAQRLTGAGGFAVAGIASDGQRAVELLRTCRRVYVTDFPMAEGNARLRELIDEAERLGILERAE